MNLMRDTEAETNGSRARARCSGAFRPVHISVYFLFTVIRGGGRFYIPVFRTRRLRRGSTEDGAHTSEPWIWFQSRFCPSVCQKVTSSLKKNSNTIIALNKDFGVSYKVSKKKKPNKQTQPAPPRLYGCLLCVSFSGLQLLHVFSFIPQNNLAPILQTEKTQIIYVTCMGSHRK